MPVKWWAAAVAPGLAAIGIWLAVWLGVRTGSADAITLGLLLVTGGVLAWFTQGPPGRPHTGRRVRVGPGRIEIVLHRWVGTAVAAVVLAAGGYAAVQLLGDGHPAVRVAAAAALLVVVLTLPDLVRFAIAPARVVLRTDRLHLRNRTHEATIAWDRVQRTEIADRQHPDAPGLAVLVEPPIELRRRWLVLPLGRRPRPDRFIVPARFSDGIGEIEAAIEILARTPPDLREDVLGRLADDLTD